MKRVEPEIEWEQIYGHTNINGTRHLITYGGGGDGGYVYFAKSHAPGRWAWSRNWFQPPQYVKIEENVFVKWEGGIEYITTSKKESLSDNDDDEIVLMDKEYLADCGISFDAQEND
jgi:hypothetical protein